MRIALLHLDLSNGPEWRNLTVLCQAISLAARQEATWIITPEMAVQGYFFNVKNPTAPIPVQPGPSLEPIRQLAAGHRLTVFLGCAEQDAATGKYYNSCLVIGSDGQVLGRHRKLRVHGGTEVWSSKGEALEPVACPALTAGVLVCADVWHGEHSRTLQQKGAEVIVVPAAWSPGGECGPGDSWERCSAATGLPVWVCNQTGRGETLDFSQAESAVVAGGEKRLAYSGPGAVLLFDWDCAQRRLLSAEFAVTDVDVMTGTGGREQ